MLYFKHIREDTETIVSLIAPSNLLWYHITVRTAVISSVLCRLPDGIDQSLF